VKNPHLDPKNDKSLLDKLEALQESTAVITSSAKLEDILQDTVDIVVRKMGYHGAVIFLVDEEENVLRSHTVSNTKYVKKALGYIKIPFHKLFAPLEKDSKNLSVQTVLQKRVLWSDSLADFAVPAISKSLSRIVEKVSGHKSGITVPIITNNKCIGTIMFTSGKIITFKEDVPMLQAFSNQLGLAIEHARLTSKLEEAEIFNSLKNYNNPQELEHSSLLNLKVVTNVARKKKIDKVEALKSVIDHLILYLKPKIHQSRRTLQNIKYEIARMITYDGATESQIMWDLGFDIFKRSVSEKLSQERNPRFPVNDVGDYPATSIRSFKRLKKQMLQTLSWKLSKINEID
jgi:hypothetical protein